MSTRTIHGVGASVGIATGPVFRYEVREQVVERRHAEDTAAELARLDAALTQAQAEIQALATQARHDVGSSNASIFEAHEMFLSDPELLEEARTMIATQHVNADYAWETCMEQHASELRSGPPFRSSRPQ